MFFIQIWLLVELFLICYLRLVDLTEFIKALSTLSILMSIEKELLEGKLKHRAINQEPHLLCIKLFILLNYYFQKIFISSHIVVAT